MPAPALRIPVSVDLDTLKREMDQGANHVGQTVRAISASFDRLHGAIGAGAAGASGAYAASWAASAARIVTVVGGIALAVKALTGAISGAREEIADMVAIADKANARGLSPEFFQAFTLAGKTAHEQVEVLEKALLNARRSTLPTLDQTASVFDTDRVKTQFNDIEQAIQRAVTLLQGLSIGPQLFQQARTFDEQVRSVLLTIRDLESAGQRIEALNLAQKFFGPQFVESVRQGKIVIDDLIRSVEERLAAVNSTQLFGEQIISSETVRRAKELDDRLKQAWITTEQNLKPTWGVLGNLALDIKNAWVSIVELIAKASSLLPQITRAMSESDRARLSSQRDDILSQLEFNETLSRQRRNQLQNQVNAINAAIGLPEGLAEAPRPRLAPIGLDDIRRTLGGPTPRDQARSVSRDRFESSADVIEKRTAALEAELRTIDLTTDARTRARVAAELETVAKQVNSEAGLGANVVTEEQRQRIDELADAYGRVALAIENARSPLATFARESANINRQLNQFAAENLNQLTNELASVVTGTKSVKDAFRTMANAIIQDLARIAIRQAITGPIASALGGLFGGGSNSFPIFAPGNANGTDFWRGGMTWVGEKGPELVNLPRGSQVIPNHIATQGIGGGMSVAPVFQIDARGADQGAVLRIETALRQFDRNFTNRTVQAFRSARGNGML